MLGSIAKQRNGRGAIVALMLAVLLVVGAMSAHVAHASAEPTIVQTAGTNWNNNFRAGNYNHFEASFGSSITSGDELVALFSYGGGSSCGSLTFSDSYSNTWTQQVSAQDGLYDTTIIATAPITTGGIADSVDVAFPTSPGCGLSTGPYVQVDLTAVEISGQATGGSGVSGTASLTQNGGGGTSHATNAGLASSNDDLDLAMYTDGGSNTSISVPAGETLFGTKQDSTANFQFALASAEAQSSMSFTTSGSAGYASVAAVSIASA